MPQTPISITTQFNSSTPATMYTVPAGRQAVVNSVLCSSVIGGYPSVTINKVSGGVQYPIVVGAVTGYAAATASNYNTPQNQTLNLLNGPVTLGANESLSISTSTTAAYKFPTNITPTTNPNWRIQNIAYFSSGVYVAVGWDASTGFGLIVTSSDGTNWTKQTFNNLVQLTDVAFNGSNTYIVVGTGNGGNIWYSNNLTSWTGVSAFSADMYCATFGNSRFVVGGQGGRIWHSTDALSWTSAILTINTRNLTNDVNSILTVGSNWAFGTSGVYYYSSNLVTAVTPYYIIDTAGNATSASFWSINSAGTVISGLGIPSSQTTSSIYYSTNQGKSWTASNLSALSNLPTQRTQIMSFNNGSTVAWMSYHPGNSRYLASSDGINWTSQNYTGSYGSNTDTWYSTNLWGVNNANGNSFLSYIPSASVIAILTANSSGVLNLSLSFASDNTYVNPTYGYGMQACGNGNSNGWLAVSVSAANGQYAAGWYGSSVSNGANNQFVDYLYFIPSYSYTTCMCYRPATSGFIYGTATGYLLTSDSQTGAPTTYVSRPFTNSIAGIATAGNTATSRIVVLYSSGATAFSTDQGQTWTTGNSIPSSAAFGTTFYQTAPAIQYANGAWIAVNNNGQFFYSSDASNWTGNPVNISSIYSLNNNNVMLLNNALAYTAGTSVDDIVFSNTTTNFQGFASVRRAAYVSGTYIVAASNNILTSTNLSTWSSVTSSATTINNQNFVVLGSQSGTGAIAYSGTGSNIVVSSARRSVSGDNAYFGIPTAITTALNVGFATAGIVEIS